MTSAAPVATAAATAVAAAAASVGTVPGSRVCSAAEWFDEVTGYDEATWRETDYLALFRRRSNGDLLFLNSTSTYAIFIYNISHIII